MPAAEVEVSPDLVRRLLAAQHPDLSGLPVEVMNNGWDNLICQLGGELLVRLPRRAAAWDRPPVWLHGDLHPANILVHRGSISAVIDFGDITSGDPAGDLSVAWMLLPAECHDAFRDAYRAAGQDAAGAETCARARGWALALSLAFLANSADNPMIAGIGRRTLSAVRA